MFTKSIPINWKKETLSIREAHIVQKEMGEGGGREHIYWEFPTPFSFPTTIFMIWS